MLQEAQGSQAKSEVPASIAQRPALPVPNQGTLAGLKSMKYARECEYMESIGFTDSLLNTHLLIRNNGDVHLVVDWLLERDYQDEGK